MAGRESGLEVAYAKVKAIVDIVSWELQGLPAPLAFTRMLALVAGLAGRLLASERGGRLLVDALAEWACASSDYPRECERRLREALEALVAAGDVETVEAAKKAALLA